MVQGLMAGYWTDVLVGYVKGGIIGWAVWFAMAFVYLLWSFGLNLELYHVDGEKGEKVDSSGMFRIVLWPVGMIYMTNELVKHVNAKLKRKGN